MSDKKIFNQPIFGNKTTFFLAQAEENLNHWLNKVSKSSQIYELHLTFCQYLYLRDHSKWRAKKSEHGEGIMLIWKFVLEVIYHERKKLTHHEIINRIAEQTE